MPDGLPTLPPFAERMKTMIRRMAGRQTASDQHIIDVITMAEAARVINAYHNRYTRLAEAVLGYHANATDPYADRDEVTASYEKMTRLAGEAFR